MDESTSGDASALPAGAAHATGLGGCADGTLVRVLQHVGPLPTALLESPGRVSDEAWLRGSVDALQEAFFIFEAERDEHGDVVDLRYRFLNAAAERLYGRPSVEVVGRGLLELFPSVVGLGIFACYVEPLHTGRPTAMRVPSFDDNGVVGAFDVTAHPYAMGSW